MKYSRLSIIITVFNQRYDVASALQGIKSAKLPDGMEREIIFIDDGSTDGSVEALQKLASSHPEIIVLHHDRPRGPGACFQTALARASGELCLVQDVQLAYNPDEYERLLTPVMDGVADAVLGSRFLPHQYRRVIPHVQVRRHRRISSWTSILTNRDFSDVLCPFKLFRTIMVKSIPLRCRGLGVSNELLAKLVKRGFRLCEVPVSYRGWSYGVEKPISFKQMWSAMAAAVAFYFIDDIYEKQYGHDILHRLSATHRFNRWMADTIRPWVGDNVLEIGAGMGNLTMKLLPRSQYVVSDIDPLHLDFLSQVLTESTKVRVERADLESVDDFNRLAGQFDTVVCLNVVEHVKQDELALSNINKALMPGGRACILVPQIPGIYGTLDTVLGHYRRYTQKELAEKMERAGFVVEKIFSFNRPAVPAWWLNGRILRATNFGRLQLKIYDSLVWLFRRIDKMLPWRGVSVIVIGRKP